MATITNNSALIVPPAAPGPGTNDIRGVKPPVPIPNGWAWLIWLLVIAALTAAGIWFWKFRKKKKALEPVTPPVPAHVRARQRLQAALGLIQDPRLFCIEVSDALRTYLEERFRFHAPDRTTEEFMQELHDTHILTFDQKASLQAFLQSCDLVKFARHEPTEASLRELHESALRLIEETQYERIQRDGSSAPPPVPEMAVR